MAKFNLLRLADWLDHIKDRQARLKLIRRLGKVESGNLGDVSPVGNGVSELREHFGSGWRMYFIQRGQILIVMLGGGDKSSQARDIDAAKKLAATLED